MKRFTPLGAALLLALGLAVVPAATAPAAAHGGKIDIELGTDGAGGVSAALTWAGDGHPVEESAVVVVQAVSDAGDEVGPVTLVSASEGVGWYRSDPELLGEGHWTVTARATEPKKAKVEVQVDVAAPAAPPSEDEASDPAQSDTAHSAPAESGPAPSGPGAAGTNPDADAAGAAAAAGDGAPSSGGVPAWTGWVLGALVVAGGAAAVVRLRRGKT
ncbi:hypothetical protein [Promicromonospora iranensis]|uniref:CopC domain-containing protein n=1 Tax=Promicromonospora iranensis TaxID=1105144 RepID=A0ABU2CSF7_9MICO|nr:hypothetical protein [Promicromonospora iranensis]MDR7384268.1 hypothetical protein [Promicromonospora iranensis]